MVRVTGLMLMLLATSTAAAGEIGLRVHDARGAPGDRVALVLRTYASRPIEQGQVCLRVAGTVPGESKPWAVFESARVFSDIPDVSANVTVELLQEPQTLVIQFNSPSATINASDGPLAVFLFELSDDLQPGQVFELFIDIENTSFIDENGLPIVISPRSGTLTIQAPGDPIPVAAHAEDTEVGQKALLSLETFSPILLSGGQVGIRFEPSVAAGPPTVRMDPRHGPSTYAVVSNSPGLVVVAFDSVNATLNSVPGDLVEVSLPTLPSLPANLESPIFLDPTLTFLFDSVGQLLPLSLQGDVLVLLASLTAFPGVVSDLRLSKLPDGQLQLAWGADCGGGTAYAVYRGDLRSGYDSLAPEPGLCSVSGTSAALFPSPGTADFFVVVPHLDGLEGSYGRTSDRNRDPATTVCFPQGTASECVP